MIHQAPRGRRKQATLRQPPPYDNDPQGPYSPQRPKGRRLYSLLGLGGLVVPIVMVAAGCSSGGASAVTVNGTVNPSSGVAVVFGPGINATTYAGCAKASPAPGTQIKVTDPSGKVIGTGTLGRWTDTSVTAQGLKVYPCDMPFTINNVPSEQRYGFAINGVPGMMWETSVSGPVHLSVGGS
jgi:hypothetical protein